MPYIKKDYRKGLDTICDMLIFEFDNIEMRRSKGTEGLLNYFLFRLAKKTCVSYSDFMKFEGDIQQSLREIYRRQVSPYEDKKKKENGDVE